MGRGDTGAFSRIALVRARFYKFTANYNARGRAPHFFLESDYVGVERNVTNCLAFSNQICRPLPPLPPLPALLENVLAEGTGCAS